MKGLYVMKNKKLGFITIGQSPRTDIMEDVRKIIPENIEIIEAGALDRYDRQYIQDNLSPGENSQFLVSRMRDGSQVEIAEEKIHSLLQNCVDHLNKKGCNIILMMCTGKIPELLSKVPILPPQKILHNIMKNIGFQGKIGVFIPEKEQELNIRKAWNSMGMEIFPVFASPYGNIDNIKKESLLLDKEDISVIFMDCMGYSEKMKNMVYEITGKAVIIPRTMIVKIALELI
jgi:protein AroM